MRNEPGVLNASWIGLCGGSNAQKRMMAAMLFQKYIRFQSFGPNSSICDLSSYFNLFYQIEMFSSAKVIAISFLFKTSDMIFKVCFRLNWFFEAALTGTSSDLGKL